MKKAVISLILSVSVSTASVLSISAFAASGSGKAPQEHPAHTGNIDAGKTKSATCAACHGVDGNSVVPAQPKLAGQGEKYLVKQLQNFKSGERDNAIMMGMAAALSEEDMRDIAAYYSQQVVTLEGVDEKYLAVGKKIYQSGVKETGVAACTACHGSEGKGMPSAGFPSLQGQHPAYLMAQLKAFRAAARGDQNAVYRQNDSGQMMRNVAKNLTDDQIEALAHFISGLY